MAIREQENPAESVSASAQPAQLAAGPKTTSRLRVPEPRTVRGHWGPWCAGISQDCSGRPVWTRIYEFAMDRCPSSAIPGFPAPVATEAVAMPAQQRLGLDDRDGVQNRRKPAIERRTGDHCRSTGRRRVPCASVQSPAAAARHSRPRAGSLTSGASQASSAGTGGMRPSRPTLCDSVIRSSRTRFSAHTPPRMIRS
jgi:hypothetical protein